MYINERLKTIKKILNSLGLYKHITRLYDVLNFEYQFILLKRNLDNLSNENRVFFFFPFYHTGGAEIVHLNIVKSVSNYSTVTIFSLPSGDEDLKKEFFKVSNCFDIQLFIRSKKKRKILVQTISKKINNQKKTTVFGCYSHFLYDLLPYLDQKITKIDLLHAFTGYHEPGHEKDSIPFVNYFDKRIVITKYLKNQLEIFYDINNISSTFKEKIQVIYNATHFVANEKEIKRNEKFTLLYIGRNSPEKRVHLIAKIATRLQYLNLNTEVVLIGANLEDAVLPEDKTNCIFIGSLNQDEIEVWYKKANVTLITSKREGFPMVFMESMIFGCVPISTRVGGIPELITNAVNGILIDDDKDEEEIIDEFCIQIESLVKNTKMYHAISENAFQFANANFGMQRFRKEYQNLILNV
jgi:glycosyltransferase involved in cell wall biosynthesis